MKKYFLITIDGSLSRLSEIRDEIIVANKNKKAKAEFLDSHFEIDEEIAEKEVKLNKNVVIEYDTETKKIKEL